MLVPLNCIILLRESKLHMQKSIRKEEKHNAGQYH
nr:MAG TPA: hypothetical protein [Caudoviricetes sp.]